MKIVLDASALEYLMKQGGEGFQLEIKAAALNAAAQHILKAVTPPLVLKQVEAEAYKVVINEIGHLKTEREGYHSNSTLILKPEYQTKLQEIAKDAVGEAVRTVTNTVIDQDALKKQILERITHSQAVIDYYIKELDAKIEKMVAEKLTEGVNNLIHMKIKEAVNKIEVTL